MKPLSDFTEWPKFAVFDIEASKWVDVLCLCHVDEYGNRKLFKTIAEYMDWLWSDEFRDPETKSPGEFVWAHWGGHYDSRFIMAEAFKRRWGFETIQSGNLIVVMTVTGKQNGKRRVIKFCESARIMPDSVEAVGKSVSLPKLDADRSHAESVPWDELVEYCYRDCDIVLKGLIEMRSVMQNAGVDYANTLASMMTRYVRRSKVLDPKHFYEKDRETKKWVPRRAYLEGDEFCIPAYFGGRTEVGKLGRFKGPLYYYDISSSYPYSMLFELPAYYEGCKAPMLKRNGQVDIERSLRERCGITRAVVEMPEGCMKWPVLPIRAHHKILFATLRHYESCWTNIELLALWQRLKNVPGFRLTLKEQAVFTPLAFMKPFVELFWCLRLKAIEDKDDFKKYAFKIALNSASGKLGEQSEKTSVVFGQAYNDAVAEYGREALRPTKVPGVYYLEREARGGFRHMAAASYVTGRSRLLLLEGIEACVKAGFSVHYCDTDSIITDCPPEIFSQHAQMSKPGEKVLGAWNLEFVIDEAEIWAPKNYRLVLRPGTFSLKDYPSGIIYRAKGMPIDRREERKTPHIAAARWKAYTQKHQGVVLPKPIKEGIRGLKSDLNDKSERARRDLFPVAFALTRTVQNGDSKRHHRNGDSEPLHLEVAGCGLNIERKTG